MSPIQIIVKGSTAGNRLGRPARKDAVRERVLKWQDGLEGDAAKPGERLAKKES